MKFYKPKFWDERGQSLISILLLPISFLIIIKN